MKMTTSIFKSNFLPTGEAEEHWKPDQDQADRTKLLPELSTHLRDWL